MEFEGYTLSMSDGRILTHSQFSPGLARGELIILMGFGFCWSAGVKEDAADDVLVGDGLDFFCEAVVAFDKPIAGGGLAED